jgi:hypothetical protein
MRVNSSIMKKATEWNSYNVVKRKNIRVKIWEHNRLETDKVSGHEATIEHQYGNNDSAID